MKRSIVIVLGLAALAAPVAHAGGAPARLSPVQRIIAQENRGAGIAAAASGQRLSPVERIIAQEQARQNDPALFGSGPAATWVEIVESNGFHWGDAGIGAAVMVAVTLTLVGTTLVVRTRRPGRA